MKTIAPKLPRYVYYIILGLIAIFAVSVSEGFFKTFIQGLQHIKTDFTSELNIHIYIFGWILLIYGIYKYFRAQIMN